MHRRQLLKGVEISFLQCHKQEARITELYLKFNGVLVCSVT